jgi:hypothetical protein
MAGNLESHWLDGPKFIAWLESEHGFKASHHGSNAERRAQRWKNGDMVSIWKADELLTKLSLHISLIPEAVWLAAGATERYAKPEGRPNFTNELREQVIARREAGASPRDLAIETGVSERTIRKWTQKAKQKAGR